MQPQFREQEPMRSDPTQGLQHEQSPDYNMGRRHGSDPGIQGRAQGFGLPVKATHPELATLVRHVGLHSGRRLDQGAALQKARHQKQSYDRNTEAEIRQGELRQQRDRAPTGPAQITAHADGPIKAHVHQSAAIKAVAQHLLPSPTLWAMGEAVVVRIGDRFGVLLEGTTERV
jgi:hypothetical protein